MKKRTVSVAFLLCALLAALAFLPACGADPSVGDAEKTSQGISDTVEVGDLVNFGTVEFDAYYGGTYSEAPDWKVLKIEGSNALVITEDAIEMRPYFEDYGELASEADRQAAESGIENLDEFNRAIGATWERSSLRRWLNTEFYSGLSAELAKHVVSAHVVTGDNPAFGTYGGADTEDMVFLLSIEEASEYFAADADRKASLSLGSETNAAVKDRYGFDVRSELGSGCRWWLRSPGSYPSTGAYVDSSGGTDYNPSASGNDGSVFDGISGSQVDADPCFIGVRPAMWVQLPSNLVAASE